MIVNYSEYEAFLKPIIEKAKIMKTSQLINCLINSFEGMKENEAKSVLVAFQRRRYIELSTDGYAMGTAVLRTLTEGRFFDKDGMKDEKGNPILDLKGNPIRYNTANFNTHIEGNIGDLINEFVSEKQKAITDSMWIVSDMMPDSSGFFEASDPWSLVFDMPGDEERSASVFKILKVPEDNRLTFFEMLRELPVSDSGKIRRSTKMIAIVNNKDDASRIPPVGFSHICVIDESKREGYRLIERRSDDKRYGNIDE